MGKTGKMIGHVIGNIVAAFISLIVIIPSGGIVFELF